MAVELKNPCLSCELLHEDKGNETCRKCEKRWAYVEALGGMTHSVPEGIMLAGNAGMNIEGRGMMDEGPQLNKSKTGFNGASLEEKERRCNICRHVKPIEKFPFGTIKKAKRLKSCEDCIEKYPWTRYEPKKDRDQGKKVSSEPLSVSSEKEKDECRISNTEHPTSNNEEAKNNGNTKKPDIGGSGIKNKLADLNDYLFDQMERLSSDNLSGDAFSKEIIRAKTISHVASQIIGNARLVLDAHIAVNDRLIRHPVPMLGVEGYDEKE